MASLAHGMKKRMSKVATRKKTIEANISAAYTAAKKQLQREKKALHEAMTLIEGASFAWGEVAGQQKNLAQLVETEAPIEGALHAPAISAVSALRALHTETSGQTAGGDAVAKMMGHVKAYIAEIESVEGEFKKVETLYTETQRYEKKVGKLSTKENKEEKTKRNVEKLEGARAAQQRAVDGMVERMGKTSAKFEAVLQCAQTAFWIKQDKLLGAVTQKTAEARAAALGVSEEMQKMDVGMAELKVMEPAAVRGSGREEVTEAPAAAEVEAEAEAEAETEEVTAATEGGTA